MASTTLTANGYAWTLSVNASVSGSTVTGSATLSSSVSRADACTIYVTIDGTEVARQSGLCGNNGYGTLSCSGSKSSSGNVTVTAYSVAGSSGWAPGGSVSVTVSISSGGGTTGGGDTGGGTTGGTTTTTSAGAIYLGSNKIKKIYLGTKEIKKVYLGDKLVFSGFPDEYQQIEYLESNGNQWIDTRVQALTNMTAEMDIKFTAYEKCFFGRLNGASSYTLVCGQRWMMALNEWYSGGTGTANVLYNVKTFWGQSEQWLEIDGNRVITTNEAYNSSSNTLGIFKAANDNTILQGKVYNLKIWINNTLERDYVPCYRKSDNVAGLYDLVTNTLYTNNGSGSFIKGPNVE